MKCPKCQFDNPEDKRFCGECGAKMEGICPKCNSSNPPRFKFCGECGHNLAEPTEKNAPAFDSERKNATILFSDVVGYTAMTERLDPEDVKEIMGRIFGEIAQVVTKYGGVIERFFGDEVMVLFGVPKAHEDDPVRAIKAAREIHRLVESMSPKYEAEIGHPLAMHTGINTGLLITGDEYIGKGRHGLTGDAVNLAARLTKLAQAGETLVGPETYRQAEGYFIFEHLEPKRVKGKAEPVKAYQVIAPSTRRTRFEISAERGLTPLVGRERELEQLQAGFQRCKGGRGGAFSIVSEAGFGKSRLLYEFRKAVAREDVTFLEGKCLSYSKGTVYQPVIDILKSTFDIMEGDGDTEVREKTIKGLKILGADETSTLPYLLELLSVKDSGLDRISMSPEGKKDRIIDALKRIVIRGSEIRPLILAVEDLHWIDKSSEDAFKELLNSLSGARILIIFTYRPEYVPSWGVKSYHSQINLNRLSEGESLSMLTDLLGTLDIDRALEELITGKTEGAPFFIEEFIKSLKDLRIIEKKDKYYLVKNIEDVAIPSTIQDVIMARVDLLPEGAKEVLQTGSVIEREFSYELIKQATGVSEQALLSHLSALRDSELVYERGIFPQTSYIFKHALTRDVVYNSILNRRKKELHQRIGLAIEETYRDNLDEACEGLAEHFKKCEDFRRAAAYLKMAGAKATNRGAITESVNYARKTVACLERLPKNEEVLTRIVDIRTILGIRLMDMNYFHQSKEIISPVIETATDMGRTRRISQIHSILGSYHFCVREDFPQAFNHHYRSLEIARGLADSKLLPMAHYWVGWPLAFSCDFKSALDHFNQALDIHIQAGNPIWVPIITALIGNIAYHYWGRQESAYECSHKAVALADESGDIYTRLLTYSCHGVSCLGKGDMNGALEYLSIGLAVAEQIDQFYWRPGNHQFLGDIYYELGDYQKSIGHYQKAIRSLERSGNLPSWKNIIELVLIRTGLAADQQLDFDPNFLAEYSTSNKLCVYDGLIKRHIGEIMMYLGQLGEAENWLKKAVETHQRNGMRFHLAGDYAIRAEVCKRQDDPTTAREYLACAIEIFKKCGADGWVEKYEKELAALS